MPRLRRRIAWFVLGTAAVMAVLPAINLARPAPTPALFDTAFAWPAIGGVLRRMGISTRPQQVVVGKSGWLFLGDQYAHAITDKRRPADDRDAASAVRQAAAIGAWGDWLRRAGVDDWRVLVCADKDSVYPERLPDWDRPAALAPIDAMLARADRGVVVDTRPALREARATDLPALFLRTDSHWTARGAWIAYRALAQSHAAAGPGIAWLQDADVRLTPARRPSGDLARLLQVSDADGDDDAALALAPARDAGRTQADAGTGRALDAFALASVEAPRQPVLIRSPQALNARRVLWLRDSFGTALLPYLAATFGEVVQVDRQSVAPARLAELVRRWKPSSVLVTVVERNARDPWFAAPPPASAQ